jgi:hypothetical protein
MNNKFYTYKNCPTTKLSKPVFNNIDILIIDKIEYSNYGKTAKNDVFKNAMHCFVGQVPCSILRTLNNSSNLKANKSKSKMQTR